MRVRRRARRWWRRGGRAHGGLGSRLGMMVLAVGVVCLAAVVWLAPRAFVVQRAIKDTAPAALSFQAHKILDKFGYGDRAGRGFGGRGFAVDQSYYIHVQQEMSRWMWIGGNCWSRPRPGLVSYWYRQSPELLVPWHADLGVGANDPPSGIPGMVRVYLDPQGHLIGFEADPVDVNKASAETKKSGVDSDSVDVFSESDSTDEGEPDWEGLLFQPDVVNVDAARLTSVTPQEIPPVYADHRAAWAGSLTNATDEPLRIEAAAYRGRIVWFTMTGNWKKYSDDAAEIAGRGSFNIIFQTSLIVVLLAAGCYLAFRN